MQPVPKLADLRNVKPDDPAAPLLRALADALEQAGITDADLPDELPEGLDLNDPAVLQQYLPQFYSKVIAHAGADTVAAAHRQAARHKETP